MMDNRFFPFAPLIAGAFAWSMLAALCVGWPLVMLNREPEPKPLRKRNQDLPSAEAEAAKRIIPLRVIK